MRIRATTKLAVEDFSEQKGWIGKIITPLNNFFTQAVKIINGGIVFEDNFLGEDHLFDFTYQSDALSFPIGFKWGFSTPPRSLIVVSATEESSTQNITPIMVSVAWELTSTNQVELTSVVKFNSASPIQVADLISVTNVTIPKISYLEAGKRYKIRTRVTP